MKSYFRSNTIYNQSPSLIDRENGIIKDIVLCQTGEAKGHELFINEQFINKVVEFGNENKAGIKARFGHPNICSTALGTYLGRYKNFRKEDNKAIADLFLDSTSKKSPNGNLYDYVLDLAESNPDMFGASIAFKAGKAEKRLETVNDEEIEKAYATILKLHACDLVDDPASTEGLFESLHEDDLAFQVSVFLDEHPEIYQLLDKKPEILDEFLTNYASSKAFAKEDKNHKNDKTMNIRDEINNLKKWITDNFSKASKGSDTKADTEHDEGHAELVEAFENQITALESKLKSQEQTEALENEITTLYDKAGKLATDHKFPIDFDKTDSPDKLKYFSNVLSQAELVINSQLETINQLQSDLNKSKAFPTVPDKKADPKLNIQKKINTDDSGKVLLENIPDSAKRKLKQIKSKV
jgi:hypothetical protein